MRARGFFLVRLPVTRGGIGMLLAQIALLLVIAALVAGFPGTIPVPPGWSGPGHPGILRRR